MSSSSDITLGTIGTNAGIPNLNVATIPANIRNGDSKAKQAYSEGLAFEDVLVNELSQQLANTMYGGSDDGSSSSDGADGTDGILERRAAERRERVREPDSADLDLEHHGRRRPRHGRAVR